MNEQQTNRVLELLGRLDERTELMYDTLEGKDGKKGLRDRVDDLEASQNRVKGGIAVLGVLGGLVEWLFHIRK